MTTDNTPKKAVISKKWLYGSLAVAALLIGIFLDNDAVAGQNNLAINSVEQVSVEPVTVEKVIVKQATIDNQYYEDVDKNTESTTDTKTDDSESYEDDMED